MEKFFDSSEPGAGFFIRSQTEEIVLNNIYWIGMKEEDIIMNFVPPTKF